MNSVAALLLLLTAIIIVIVKGDYEWSIKARIAELMYFLAQGEYEFKHDACLALYHFQKSDISLVQLSESQYEQTPETRSPVINGFLAMHRLNKVQKPMLSFSEHFYPFDAPIDLDSLLKQLCTAVLDMKNKHDEEEMKKAFARLGELLYEKYKRQIAKKITIVWFLVMAIAAILYFIVYQKRLFRQRQQQQ